jgi:hypothetical protein
MATSLISEIRIRPKHQLTLPAHIVRQAQLQSDDRMTVVFINGNIVLTPQKKQAAQGEDDIMAYAGIGRGVWGDTHDDVMATVADLRASQWER